MKTLFSDLTDHQINCQIAELCDGWRWGRMEFRIDGGPMQARRSLMPGDLAESVEELVGNEPELEPDIAKMTPYKVHDYANSWDQAMRVFRSLPGKQFDRAQDCLTDAEFLQADPAEWLLQECEPRDICEAVIYAMRWRS